MLEHVILWNIRQLSPPLIGSLVICLSEWNSFCRGKKISDVTDMKIRHGGNFVFFVSAICKVLAFTLTFLAREFGVRRVFEISCYWYRRCNLIYATPILCQIILCIGIRVRMPHSLFFNSCSAHSDVQIWISITNWGSLHMLCFQGENTKLETLFGLNWDLDQDNYLLQL